MSRSRLSAMGVIYEALGFAVRYFPTALRVAWLPILLIVMLQAVMIEIGLSQGTAVRAPLEPGFITKFVLALQTLNPMLIGLLGIGAMLQASYMVPLVRYAAHGEAPHHGTMRLSFGPRHLVYLVAAAASFAFVILLLQLAFAHGVDKIDGPVEGWLGRETAVFDQGSLHSVETQPVYGPLGGWVDATDAWFFSMGINLGAIDAVFFVPLLLLAGYLIIRLLAFPYLVAAWRPGDGYNSLRQSLAISGGWHVFPLVAVVGVLGLLSIGTVLLTLLGAAIVLPWLSMGSEVMIANFEMFLPDTNAGPWVRGGIFVLAAGIMLALNVFVAALQAGMGGALVHRARAEDW